MISRLAGLRHRRRRCPAAAGSRRPSERLAAGSPTTASKRSSAAASSTSAIDAAWRGRSRARRRRSTAAARAALLHRRGPRPPPRPAKPFVGHAASAFEARQVQDGLELERRERRDASPARGAAMPAMCGVANELPVATRRAPARARRPRGRRRARRTPPAASALAWNSNGSVAVVAADRHAPTRSATGSSSTAMLCALATSDARGETTPRRRARAVAATTCALARGQAEVHDVEALPDRPLEPGQQRRRGPSSSARARARCAVRSRARSSARCPRTRCRDRPRHRLVGDDALILAVDLDGARSTPARRRADARLDAAVDDAHAHATTGRPAPRPFAIDRQRPVRAQAGNARGEREAPCRQDRGICRAGRSHPRILTSPPVLHNPHT